MEKIISEKGCKDNPISTYAIEKLHEPPKTVGDLRKLLVFLGYYRQSIENFSRKVKSIYDMLSLPSENVSKSNHKLKKTKGQKSSYGPILWSKDHANIISNMSNPDFTKPFIAHCDASEKGLGTVLYQEIDGKMKVISYASRALAPIEKNYHLHSGKFEFLTLKWSVTEQFRDYLYYANEFTVYSYNNPLL